MKKQAILLIHFGTTHDDTREKTIDAFRKKVELSFADCDVFEAFTSRMYRDYGCMRLCRISLQ